MAWRECKAYQGRIAEHDKMKPQFTFKFMDEPQFETDIGRPELAQKLRAYRKHKAFQLRKAGTHRYFVRIIGYASIGGFNVK